MFNYLRQESHTILSYSSPPETNSRIIYIFVRLANTWNLGGDIIKDANTRKLIIDKSYKLFVIVMEP